MAHLLPPEKNVPWAFAQVYAYSNLHRARYGFVITNEEFIALQRETRPRDINAPRNGHISVSKPVKLIARRGPDTQTDGVLTARLAIVYFLLLAAHDEKHVLRTTMWDENNRFMFNMEKYGVRNFPTLEPGSAPFLDF